MTIRDLTASVSAFALAIGLAAGGAYAANVGQIDQVGNTNTATVDQSAGDENEAFVDQGEPGNPGNNNQAVVTQSDQESDVRVNQTGDSNSATVTTAGTTSNEVGVVQEGDSNTVGAGITGGNDNELSAIQDGNTNTITSSQDGTQNFASLRQNGDGNFVGVTQVGEQNIVVGAGPNYPPEDGVNMDDANDADFGQVGSDEGEGQINPGNDLLNSERSGDDNIATQGGNDNFASLYQEGFKNKIAFDSEGDGNTVSATQFGDENVATIDQRNTGGDEAIVFQAGNNNTATVEQASGGTGNLGTVTQTGNGNTGTVLQ